MSRTSYVRQSLLFILLSSCVSVDHLEPGRCPAAVVVEPPGSLPEEWTADDRRALAAAHSGCRRHYSPEHCLVKFEKRSKLNYHAVCALPTSGEE